MAMQKRNGGSAPRRWREDEAREAMAAWEASGHSGAAFARTRGMDPQRLFWWRRRFNGAESTKSMFVPVVVKPSPSGASAAVSLSMPSSSMADQVTWATELLRPIWRLLLADVLGATVMHVDGTSLPVLDHDSPKGIVTGALWGYVGDTNCAVYLYTSTAKKNGQRPGEVGPAAILALRKGPVVADASNLFDESFKCVNIVEVGCNMHARRYFLKALDANDARAAVPIAAFRTLYDVEDTVRDADPERRRDERQRRSKPVYDELLRWCRTYEPTEPPKALLGRAIHYLIHHHLALMRFLDDGRLPIDNGIVERLHRRPAVGRRNYLFAGSHAAGERAAIAYSILGTCRLLDVHPMEYLADVLPRLARV